MPDELHPFDQIRASRIGYEAEVFLACEGLKQKGASIGEEWRIVGIAMADATRAFDGLARAIQRSAH